MYRIYQCTKCFVTKIDLDMTLNQNLEAIVKSLQTDYKCIVLVDMHYSQVYTWSTNSYFLITGDFDPSPLDRGCSSLAVWMCWRGRREVATRRLHNRHTIVT